MQNKRIGRPRVAPEIRLQTLYTPEPNSGCWLWLGATAGSGYPTFGPGGRERSRPAHRVVFAMTHGRNILDGHEIDHLCRNKFCVNPAHLEEVTHQENMRRRALAHDRCKHGHELVASNTYVDARGWKTCRTCRDLASARYRKGRSSRANGAKTHCKRGHEFTPENTRVDGVGRRYCRECRRERERIACQTMQPSHILASTRHRSRR